MRALVRGAALVLLLVAAAAAVAEPDETRVTYIGNAGMMVEGGGKKVLFDALYRGGIPQYRVHSVKLRSELENAEGAFADVDLILASHAHSDHFDAEAVKSHLENNRRAVFVSTPQAADQVRALLPSGSKLHKRIHGMLPDEGQYVDFKHRGIKVTALQMHHGRTQTMMNVGFIAEIDGKTFLHIGDSQAHAGEIEAWGLGERQIDVAFVPYWCLLYKAWAGVRDALGATTVVGIHVPPRDSGDPFFGQVQGGRETVLKRIEEQKAATIIFRQPLESRAFQELPR